MDAIDAILNAGELLARATAHEMEIEDLRPLAKYDAIRRIMETTTNELTGKSHSASSAEAIVESDPDYKEYLRVKRDAVANKIRLRAAYEAALAKARITADALIAA